MKTLDHHLKTVLKENIQPVLCEYVMTPEKMALFCEPVFSNQKTCDWCGGSAHYTPFHSKNKGRVWLCANTECVVYKEKNILLEGSREIEPKRAVPWKEFCEQNGIGDIYYQVKFEKVEQAQTKILYLKNFCQTPSQMIIMQGPSGTGKTYAALGLCELFTRKSISAIFTTHEQLYTQWLETFKNESVIKLKNHLTICSILVIDDFGTGEISPAFLVFFLGIINTRLQWTDRGTIITTNLDMQTISKTCGEAIMDRFSTGQAFIFEGKSRRERKPI